MDIQKKCYYASLDVPTDATLEAIKTKYRELSKQHHPDVAMEGCPKRNAEKFKEISEAYRVLSDKKERRRYDLQRSDRFWYQNHRHSSASASAAGPYADMRAKAHQGPKATGMNAVLDTMFRPRNFILGVGAFVGMTFFYSTFVDNTYRKKLKQQQHGKEMVEAWYNTTTKRWEQPAPWDTTYRKLNPVLEMVPREKVQQRTR